ncbi:adenylosuccinate synthetase [Candidatus Gracilibacteria bacterium]|nr:adenylosuccinate synthetase [Candidatus Gracilibacteria bacterium]
MNSGYADVLVGLQYGDEGKARVVDMIADQYDIIARFNGGANAGHTVETKEGGKVALNQIPSAIFYPDKILYIGTGCVINIEKTTAEIKKIEAMGITLKGRLKISSQASVVQPHHILMDEAMGKNIGTTKNGIGPCYADRAYRMLEDRLVNVRIGDLVDDADKYFAIIEKNLTATSKLYNLEPKADMNAIKEAFEYLKQFVELDTLYIQKQVESGKSVLFEGAQAVMLDVAKGSVPFVTSSNTVAAAAYFGGDLSPNYHRKTIGVAKAVMSRVGHGPFASEYGGMQSEEYTLESNEDGSPKFGRQVEKESDIAALIVSEDEFEMGKAMRIYSGEYGTVSTRPRRIGSLDLVQLKYAIRMNGVDELFITKCDILQHYSETKLNKLPLVISYDLDGTEIDYVPGSVDPYYRVKCLRENLDSFSEDLTAMKDHSELPESLIKYLDRIGEFCGCKMIGIGVGPEREQYVKLP